MANYTCTTRTNYFHVKDPDAFRSFFQRVYGSEGCIELWEEKDADGNLMFGFGSYGGIAGLRNSTDDEDMLTADTTSYDEFIGGLQEHVAENDAVIILEAGHEKLRYIVGAATILTCRDHTHVNVISAAKARAANMLGIPNWETKCEY